MNNIDMGVLNKKVMEDVNLPIESKAIYAFICSQIDGQEEVSIKVKDVTERLGMCRQTFNKYRAYLEEAGVIEVSKSGKDGGGVKTVYRLKK